MAITKQSYADLKEYWDHQRLLEYNRERLQNSLKPMSGKFFDNDGQMTNDQMFDHVWKDITTEDLEEPKEHWIPKNEKYRFEWEGEPIKNKEDKKVVLRAKPGQTVKGNVFDA